MEETEESAVVLTSKTDSAVLVKERVQIFLKLRAYFQEDTDDATLEKIVEAIANVNVKPSNSIKEDLLGESAMNNAVNICHNIQVKEIPTIA